MKKKLLYIGILALVIAGGFAVYLYPHATLAKCPDAYGTDGAGSAEYLADTDKWTNDFFDAHPDATMTDWAEARHQFWVDNHCTAALQGYEDAKAGKVDPAKMEKVENIIREELDKHSQ